MASIVKLPSGNWRAQLRHRQKSISKTFKLKSQALRWATEQQDRIERGKTPTNRDSVKTDTVGELIKMHLAPVRDLLLQLARDGTYRTRWTDDIQNEWIRNVLGKRPNVTAAQLAYT